MSKENQIIDYLYGEMTAAEKAAFEKAMLEDPGLAREVSLLQETRHQLSDLEAIEPESTQPLVIRPMYKNHGKIWTWRLGIAASLLLLLSFLQTRIEFSSNGFTVSFGKTVPANPDDFVKDASREWMVQTEKLLDNRQHKLEAQIMHMDSSLKGWIVQRDEQRQQEWQIQFAAMKNKQAQNQSELIRQVTKEGVPELTSVVQHLQIKQQQEIQQMLTAFWQEWQATRATDLHSISKEFTNLYRNVEETDALLVNLISNSGF